MRRRSFVWAAAALGLQGCVGEIGRPGQPLVPPAADGDFVMRDGARLPYRAWLPPEPEGVAPWAVVLALHGFNHSRAAPQVPPPGFMRAAIALYAPHHP